MPTGINPSTCVGTQVQPQEDISLVAAVEEQELVLVVVVVVAVVKVVPVINQLVFQLSLEQLTLVVAVEMVDNMVESNQGDGANGGLVS